MYTLYTVRPSFVNAYTYVRTVDTYVCAYIFVGILPINTHTRRNESRVAADRHDSASNAGVTHGGREIAGERERAISVTEKDTGVSFIPAATRVRWPPKIIVYDRKIFSPRNIVYKFVYAHAQLRARVRARLGARTGATKREQRVQD